MNLQEEICSRIQGERKKLLNLINITGSKLKQYPTESIVLCSSHGYTQLYIKDSSGKYKYTSKNSERAKTLVQKKYDKKIYAKALERYNKLGKMLKSMDVIFTDSVTCEFYKMPKAYQYLVNPYFSSYEEYGTLWQGREYKRKPISPNTKTYLTDRGEKVRSKSELIIANKINSLGLKYRYECMKKLNDFGYVYPDFTILDPYDYSEIILEHFGMMDNAEYLSGFLKKMEMYAAAGIFPGSGLVCTFETSSCPLSTEYLDKVLSHYFTTEKRNIHYDV